MAIAVLTSGGDAPGMNACIRAIVRKALFENIDVYGVYGGFRGLYNNDMVLFNRKDVAEIINRGGTILRSARFKEFEDEAAVKIAVDNAKALGIDTLFVIGGNGSYLGGIACSKLGLNVINLPGTIDNDILGTDYTIGFDTAVNTAVDAIDRVRDTSSSHRRASIVEVMGRNNGNIAFYAGLASGAEDVISCETGFDENKFINNLLATENKLKEHAIIILSENCLDIDYLGDLIESKIDMKVNKIILGYIQRGGTPVAYDRMMATKMGHAAVEFYMRNQVNGNVSIQKNVICLVAFEDYMKLNNKEELENKFNDNKVIFEVK